MSKVTAVVAAVARVPAAAITIRAAKTVDAPPRPNRMLSPPRLACRVEKRHIKNRATVESLISLDESGRQASRFRRAHSRRATRNASASAGAYARGVLRGAARAVTDGRATALLFHSAPAKLAASVFESRAPARPDFPPRGVRTMMHGGRVVARAFKREGVSHVFTLCGGHIMSIYDGCLDEGIAIIDVRHEQSAAHAADGWARVTGQPGVALVTAGPGLTDAVTGVATAWRANIPMVVIGGQAPRAFQDMGGLQDMAHVDLMRPITKWAVSVPSAKRLG